ncbi:WD40 repeat domain-containing protein [Planctomycetes bacterium TBK1r]|uniref:WD domain, G-beta repeat n=1 Tax=Stieleria magnilauensis TaxID=2527963 RepID=A0ABX5XP76_9BACT|nr:WD domain, G-beta repeat [Planctomycetes bacterium TBK1r]
MCISRDGRFGFGLIALVVCFLVLEPARADEAKERELWHLELRNVGGGADYKRPYSPVCFSPDGKRMAVSLANRKSVWERHGNDENSVVCKDVPEGSGIGIWELESLRFLNWIEVGAHKVIRFTPDGKSIAALDESHLLLWDAESGEGSKVELLKDASWANELKSGFCWGPNGSIVVRQSKALVQYSASGELQSEYPIDRVIDLVSLESEANRQRIIADCYYWDLSTGHKVTISPSGFCHSVIRPGTTEIWGRSDRSYGAIAKWNPSTGKVAYPFKEGLNRKSSAENGTVQWRIEGVAFSPNGKVLASIGSDSCIHLWNAASGNRIATLEVTKGPRKGKDDDGVGRPTLKMVKFSPDGKWLVACSVESVSIFKIERLKPHITEGEIHRVTQYFAGTELIQEIVTEPHGAKTLVGSMLHTEEQQPGARVAALKPDNDEVWYDAVILARVTNYNSKKGIYYNVHYEGYSRDDDKPVPEWRIRPKLAPHLKVRNLGR